jgi:guanylate kinase
MIIDDLNPLLEAQEPPPMLVVISGPSGVGKDSILIRMRELGVPFHFVVTATSRAMRPGERHGHDYHFMSREGFEQMIHEDELIEWAEVYGQYKGVPKFEIRHALTTGRDVVLRIDVQGAASIRKLAPDALLIFVAPGSPAELRQRLESRHTELPEEIEERLSVVRNEMKAIHIFDYVVINRDDALDDAVRQIRAIVEAEKHRVHPRRVRL